METLYLSGPILGCDEKTVNEWRDKIKKELYGLNYNFIDPVEDFSLRKEEKEVDYAEIIVNKANINVVKADIVFIYIPFYSMGTSYEFFLSNLFKKETIVVCETEHESAFIRFYADKIFYTLDDGITYLKERINNE